MAVNSRSAILDGAGLAFGRLGYGSCRVEDIIEAAGVSRATFYKFFDSKEQVFQAVEEAFNFSFVQAMSSVDTADLSAGETAEAMLDAYLRWLTGWRVLARTMWTDPTRPDAASLRGVRDSAFRDFVEVIATLTAAHGVPAADPFIYRGLIAAISEIGLALIELPRLTEKDLLRARVAILHMISATLAPERSASDPS